MKTKKKISDKHKAIRSGQPKIDSDILKLVTRWNKSGDKKKFKKRFDRK